jgi:hypothetical protein
MSAISAVSTANIPQPMGKVAGADSDGYNDGTTAAKTQAGAASAPMVSKPTATVGNNVNTYA